MPFDGTEFFRDGVVPAVKCGAWYARAAAALRRSLRAKAFRSPAAEPLDAAMLRVLEEARGLIEQRQDWTQGTLETLGGQRCALGALRIASDFLNYEAAGRLAHALLADIAAERGFSSIEAMNDYSRHEAVLGAFDAAIAAARRFGAVPAIKT
jgi:hypothetical protein